MIGCQGIPDIGNPIIVVVVNDIVYISRIADNKKFSGDQGGIVDRHIVE